ncbi:type I-F CRISPR-associated endoribonuclease Cas6/Csy4 [Paralysiella testudinis]|uniref:Type I-F CRISPR-associated endoribonuclease Cas6/Csy4 n=1 Tax=Paralysiella testudinis TaxID=2809020 RepID=A0A892ZLP5_9NEIS|nr:type I-F CRISPR-associated endoribonuclease Cas6/Csy4 [Paralysiella testudinis]QRQ82494.1 type I-F CRISPR-associated endoribonuclease Cas6/Csy4 [Paralysiella testudinis]
MSQSHYLELRAIPQPELTQSQVLSHLMQALHQHLPAYAGRIGVAFPGYGQARTLGGIIRLIGNEADCQALHQQLHASGNISDYALLYAVAKVPQGIQSHARYSRSHHKGPSALRRAEQRLSAQGKWQAEIADKMRAKWQTPPKLPHLQLRSASTKQTFTLWIQQQNHTHPKPGLFSAYGLSQEATVPQF